MKQVFGFEVDRNGELAVVGAQLDAAALTITKALVDPAVACRIYEAHVVKPHEHSCLGCNLQESVNELGTFLAAQLPPSIGPLVRLHLALELVNVVWERIRDVCITLEVPRRLWSANDARFASFKVARRWANFMKHPGFFGIGIHHPVYVTDGSRAADEAIRADGNRSNSQPREWVLIDLQFVRDNWAVDPSGSEPERSEKSKGAEKFKGLRATLAEPFTACVVLPNMDTLAVGICQEFTEFVDRMTEPTWVELARDHALAVAPCDWW
jgi:hypothetical protein